MRAHTHTHTRHCSAHSLTFFLVFRFTPNLPQVFGNVRRGHIEEVILEENTKCCLLNSVLRIEYKHDVLVPCPCPPTLTPPLSFVSAFTQSIMPLSRVYLVNFPVQHGTPVPSPSYLLPSYCEPRDWSQL